MIAAEETQRGCMVLSIIDVRTAVRNAPATQNFILLGRLLVDGVEQDWKIAGTVNPDSEALTRKSCLP